MTRGTNLAKYFWYHVPFMTYDFICDVILLYSTKLILPLLLLQRGWPLWTTQLDFYDIFMKSKVLYHVACLTYDVIFGDILLFFNNFITLSPFLQLNLIFTKYLSSVKLLNVTRETLCYDIILIPCLALDIWRHLWRHLDLITLIWPRHYL